MAYCQQIYRDFILHIQYQNDKRTLEIIFDAFDEPNVYTFY